MSSFGIAAPALADNPGRIDVQVTPYYDSAAPTIRVGRYSAGLASTNEATFASTIHRMKQRWTSLGFVELYVGAIRLYDLGYRREATYWFYTAQYQGRLFALFVDQQKMGSIGSRGFELYHAQGAFFQLVGPDINGYAFGDIDSLLPIIRRVQSENKTVPRLASIYPGVAFISESRWRSKNDELNVGLGALAVSLVNQKASIKQQREQNGTEARFSHLSNKQLPGGL